MANKRTVLFVDDEPFILDGFQRTYRNLRGDYDLFYCESADEALRILMEQRVDVIVSDMRMPAMDGSQLMRLVADKYPKTVRIILSGHSDEALMMQALEVTHQFLSKPCPAELLKYTIDRSCLLRDLVHSDQLREMVGRNQKLPMLPELYTKLEEETRSPNISMDRVGDIIAQDPAMTARVLRVVNSAFYGLRQEVSSPQEASVFLGLETIKLLVLHLGLSAQANMDPHLPEFSVEGLWRHGLLVASLARQIAHVENSGNDLEKQSFVAGILHDIGRLILLREPSQYIPVKECMKEKQIRFVEAEYEVLGVSHAEVGGYLLGLWGIPDGVVEAVGFHHRPGKTVGDRFSALTAVHVANSLIEEVDEETAVGEHRYVDETYLARLFVKGRLPLWEQTCREMMSDMREKETRWTKKYLL
ncbi:MAG: response regulator [Verrucomicrobiae bacterium]|nr:response regulator [Verrucomicrobiae bacterium]